MEVSGSVVGLCIYPIKGLRGIALNRADVEPRGLRHDRRWMLCDPSGCFLSQRNTPALATFAVTLGNNYLIVCREGAENLRVPLEPHGLELEATVWRNTVRVRRVSSSVDAWFSAQLQQPCSLVAMTSATDRPPNPHFSLPGDQVSLADGYPLLLANTASLADLNGRLASPAPMNRFRPSVVVEGPEPWEEDCWTRVRIGKAEFRVAKPCGRCLVTTTDQETGERGVEPLRTLATFRQFGQSINFGTYLIPDNREAIIVGDVVSAG